MQEQFKKSFCGPPAFNDPCGSTRCVDIYRAGPDGAWPASNDDDDDDDGTWPASNDDDGDDGAWPASNDDDPDHHVSIRSCLHPGDLDTLTLWTRAYFEVEDIL